MNIRQVTLSHLAEVRCFVFHADFTHLYLGDDSGVITSLNISPEQVTHHLTQHINSCIDISAFFVFECLRVIFCIWVSVWCFLYLSVSVLFSVFECLCVVLYLSVSVLFSVCLRIVLPWQVSLTPVVLIRESAPLIQLSLRDSLLLVSTAVESFLFHLHDSTINRIGSKPRKT